MTIANKLKQIKQSTDAIKASATALTGEVQTDLTSIAIILDTANPANATDILNMLGYTSTNAPDLYNAFLNSLNKEEGASYANDTSVLLPKLTLDENGAYKMRMEMFKDSTILTVPQGKYIVNGYIGYGSLFEGCTTLLWIPDLELLRSDSGTYSCARMFVRCPSLRTVGNLNMKGCENAYYMFQGCSNLESIASLDTSSVTNTGMMFNGCTKLKSIPHFNTSNVTDMSGMFGSCSALESIPLLDTSNVTYMPGMFTSCSSLSTIPQLDTSNVTNMKGMFETCSTLKSIPQLNTSKVTDMSGMFKNCYELTSVPQLDYSSVTNMSNGFNYCRTLTTAPDLNFESATNLTGLFSYSSELVTVGNLNTPNITSTSSMFNKCDKIEKIASLDVKSVTSTTSMFSYNSSSTLKYVVFKNLGQSSATSWDFGNIMKWGVNDDKYPDARQSVIDTLITYSYDRASAGKSACTVRLNSAARALLTEEEIAQITAKGFTIS